MKDFCYHHTRKLIPGIGSSRRLALSECFSSLTMYWDYDNLIKIRQNYTRFIYFPVLFSLACLVRKMPHRVSFIKLLQPQNMAVEGCDILHPPPPPPLKILFPVTHFVSHVCVLGNVSFSTVSTLSSHSHILYTFILYYLGI